MDAEQKKARELVLRLTEETGLDYTNLAKAAGVYPSTITRFMNNSKVKHTLSARTLTKLEIAAAHLRRHDQQEPADISHPSRSTTVSIIGYIGAGAEVLPDFEQVPPDGLSAIDLPFDVPNEIVGFEVLGDSMLPVYREGDAILVWRNQRLRIEDFVGQEVALRTADGRRFLKEIQRGTQPGLFNLYSHNARLIENVELAWVGEIYLIVRASQIRRAKRR